MPLPEIVRGCLRCDQRIEPLHTLFKPLPVVENKVLEHAVQLRHGPWALLSKGIVCIRNTKTLTGPVEPFEGCSQEVKKGTSAGMEQVVPWRTKQLPIKIQTLMRPNALQKMLVLVVQTT